MAKFYTVYKILMSSLLLSCTLFSTQVIYVNIEDDENSSLGRRFSYIICAQPRLFPLSNPDVKQLDTAMDTAMFKFCDILSYSGFLIVQC